jgi:hypothetical protein
MGYLTGQTDVSGQSLVDAAIEIMCECFQPEVDDETLLVQLVKVGDTCSSMRT